MNPRNRKGDIALLLFARTGYQIAKMIGFASREKRLQSHHHLSGTQRLFK
jgi:hypothetical protein